MYQTNSMSIISVTSIQLNKKDHPFSLFAAKQILYINQAGTSCLSVNLAAPVAVVVADVCRFQRSLKQPRQRYRQQDSKSVLNNFRHR